MVASGLLQVSKEVEQRFRQETRNPYKKNVPRLHFVHHNFLTHFPTIEPDSLPL